MNDAYTKALAIGNTHEKEIATNRSAVWNNLYNAATKDYEKAQEQPAFYDSAQSKLNTALALNPDSIQTYFALALVNYNKGDKDAAARFAASALEKDPNYIEAMGIISTVHLDKAVAMENAGNTTGAVAEYSAAADLLEKSFRLDPGRSENINNLILALERSNQQDRALSLTSEAVAKNPDNPSFRYAYGIYLLKQEKYPESVEQFSRAVELDPQNANYAYNCGAAYLNWGVAIKQAADKKLEESKGKNAKPDLAYQEKFREAIPHLKKSTELKPEDAQFWESLAKAYTYLGMVKESEAAFKEYDRLTK
jgi:tetratricopeptide (TPR) repeat protein